MERSSYQRNCVYILHIWRNNIQSLRTSNYFGCLNWSAELRYNGWKLGCWNQYIYFWQKINLKNSWNPPTKIVCSHHQLKFTFDFNCVVSSIVWCVCVWLGVCWFMCGLESCVSERVRIIFTSLDKQNMPKYIEIPCVSVRGVGVRGGAGGMRMRSSLPHLRCTNFDDLPRRPNSRALSWLL